MTTEELTLFFDRFDQSIKGYNEAITDYENVIKSQERTVSEEILIVLGPILIAFALALRTVKVTGEVKLEKIDAEKKKVVDNPH